MADCGAFDINAACSSFIYALSVADQYIRAGNARIVLVVGAETLTRILDWTDRSTCVLFGDGAGAAVLAADEEPGILSTHIHADGRYGEMLNVDVGRSEEHTSELQSRGHLVCRLLLEKKKTSCMFSAAAAWAARAGQTRWSWDMDCGSKPQTHVPRRYPR